jgi:hypothetical protein
MTGTPAEAKSDFRFANAPRANAMSADEAGNVSQRRFRWFQFRLRSVLWLMIVLAVAFGWLADRERWKERIRAEQSRVREQERLTEALRIARDNPVQQAIRIAALDQFISTGPPARIADDARVEPYKSYLARELC